MEAELLLAKEIGKFMNKSEIGIARSFGDGHDPETGYAFAYGFYYGYSEGLELGAEWYSDFGNFDEDFDDQSHKVGPVVIFGLGDMAELETGALFGVSDTASDVTLKAVLEFEF